MRPTLQVECVSVRAHARWGLVGFMRPSGTLCVVHNAMHPHQESDLSVRTVQGSLTRWRWLWYRLLLQPAHSNRASWEQTGRGESLNAREGCRLASANQAAPAAVAAALAASDCNDAYVPKDVQQSPIIATK